MGGSSVYLDVGVAGTGRQEVAVRVEVERPDAGPVPGEGAHDARRLQVPHFDRSRRAPGAHELLRRREAHRLHRRRVTAQALQRKQKKSPLGVETDFLAKREKSGTFFTNSGSLTRTERRRVLLSIFPFARTTRQRFPVALPFFHRTLLLFLALQSAGARVSLAQ